MEGLFGYQMQTTFWQDFTIAEAFRNSEPNAIEDTFKRAFKAWKDDRVYVTELALVLNWKGWFWYEKGEEDLARLYVKLYKGLDSWCLDTLKGDDLKYYLETTD